MRLVLKITLSAAMLAVLFLVVPWDTVREAVGRLRPSVFGVVLAGFLGGHALGLAKWRRFVNAGGGDLGVTDALHCYSAGLFSNLSLPGIVGGDVVRIGLAMRLKGRGEAAIWGGVMDRATDVLVLLLFVAVGAVLSGRALEGWLPRLILIAMLLGVGLVMAALPFVIRRPLGRWPRRIRRPLARSLVAFRRLTRTPRVAVTGIALSITIQGIFILLNAGLGRAIGIEVGLAAWFFAWPLAKLAALLPISLGGLGVRDAGLAALLLPFGVPPARSIVCSLLWQAVAVSGGLLAGSLWLILSRARRIPPALPIGTVAARPSLEQNDVHTPG